MNRLLLCTTLVSILQFLPAISQAEDNMVKSSVEKAAEAGFSELERRLIKEYLGEHGKGTERDRRAGNGKNRPKGKKGLPPGLAKKDRLPPGLEKQLQKNGTLPPGLAKRDLPDDLQSRLPPVPKGYERSVIEDATVVLVEKATGRIADIITDVVMSGD